MLFLGSRSRNATATGFSMHDRSVTHTISQSCIVCGGLSVLTGLILIIVGVISNINNAKFIGIGVVGLGVGFFLFTFVCFYGKLNICYNNWVYRSRVLPRNLETTRPPATAVASTFPFAESPAPIQKRQSLVPIGPLAPITIVTEVDIHKLVVAPSIQMCTITTTSNNVT